MLLHAILLTVLFNLLTQGFAKPLASWSPNSLTTRDATNPFLEFWDQCPMVKGGNNARRVRGSDINEYKPNSCGKVNPPSKTMMVVWHASCGGVKLYSDDKCQKLVSTFISDEDYPDERCVDLADIGKIASFSFMDETSEKAARDVPDPNISTTGDGLPDIFLDFWDKCPTKYGKDAQKVLGSQIIDYKNNDTCDKINPPSKSQSMLVDWHDYNRIRLYEDDKCQNSTLTVVKSREVKWVSCIDLANLGKIASFRMWTKPIGVRDIGDLLDQDSQQNTKALGSALDVSKRSATDTPSTSQILSAD